jgi:hypothetical protein
MSANPSLIFGTFQFNTQNGYAGINVNNTPQSTLTVGGSFSPAAKTITTNYILTGYDYTVFCNATSSISITIPSPGTCYFREVKIVDISGNAATYNITISAAAGNIQAQATYVISTNYGKVTLQNDGTNWWIT